MKNPSQKRAGGVDQGVGPEFKSQYHKKVQWIKIKYERGAEVSVRLQFEIEW
jgi:Holliday junction resolvase RusA-like endonuclease